MPKKGANLGASSLSAIVRILCPLQGGCVFLVDALRKVEGV